MLEESIERVLTQATADVLEKMFFTGFAAESDRMEDAGPRIAATLSFAGERRGTLALAISAGAARTLAADFLGIDAADGPHDEQVREVVCELANMICGNALSSLEGSALRLSAPAIVPSPNFILPPGACHRSFDLGNGWLTVALALEDQDA